jgi:hypothetical protein
LFCSRIENECEIISSEQFSKEEIVEEIEVEKTNYSEEQLNSPQTSFVSSPKTVFAPKTADMESGFLVFTDDADGMTILSDAEDLTHLAPEAGDICVPIPGLLMPGMDAFNEVNFFDEMFLNQNVCNPNIFSEDEKLKLNDENLQFNCNTNTEDMLKDKDESELLIGKTNDNTLYRSVTQNFIKNYPLFKVNDNIEDSPLPNDPFLSYNDEIYTSSPSTDSSDPYSSKSNSPVNISSPILSQTSNYLSKSAACEDVSKLSICDNDFIDDKVLEMRAPFIPIDEDFPLLLSDDLQMPYSSTNIDELINFDTLSPNKSFNSSDLTKKSSLIFDNELIGQQSSNCLEMLLQSDSSLNSKKFNLNQTTKQNINNSGVKINLNAINSNLSKCDNNSIPLSKVQLVCNNFNQIPISRKGSSIGKNQANQYMIKINAMDSPQFMMDSNKQNKGRFSDKTICTQRFEINKNEFVKPSNSNKRPFPSEPPDILYSICPNEILLSERSSKVPSKLTQVQKRVKSNNSETINRGNSVLMNLLVNGEDLTNGYSKYSNIDRVNQSSNFNINENICQKFSNTKKNSKHFLYEGQDIR